MSAILIGDRVLDFIGSSLRITHSLENRCTMRCRVESDVDLELAEGEPVVISKGNISGSIVNPGFEDGLSPHKVWDNAGGTADWSVVADPGARSGNNVLRHDASGLSGNTRLQLNGIETEGPGPHIPVSPGEQWIGRFYAKSGSVANANRVRMRAEFFNDASAHQGGNGGSWLTPSTGDWETELVVATAPAGSTYVVFDLEIEDTGNPENIIDFDDTSGVIFSEEDDTIYRGVLVKPEEHFPGPHNRVYSIEATCYNVLAERRVMAKAYQTTTVGAIVSDIITEYLADDGVVEGEIATGPIVTEALFNWIPTSAALDKLAERSGFWWHINGDKELDFGPPETFDAPFDLDEIEEFAEDTVKVTGNRDYRNRQYIRGGKAETEDRTESWKGDGDQQTFVTGFPIAREPTITVNAAAQTVDVKGIGDQDSQWFWARGSPEVTQNSSDTPLSATDVIQIVYKGLVDLVAVSRNLAEIERRKAVEGFGTGITDHVATDTTISTTASAFESASGKLNRHAIEGRSLEWKTEKPGLHSGQLITINLPELGIDGADFLITSVEIESKGSRMIQTVHAVEGPLDNDWAGWFARGLEPSDPLAFRENIGEEEEIIILEDVEENWLWDEDTDEIIHSCPVPSTGLVPDGTSLFPC